MDKAAHLPHQPKDFKYPFTEFGKVKIVRRSNGMKCLVG